MWLSSLIIYLGLFLASLYLLRRHVRNKKSAKEKICGYYSTGGEFFSFKKWLMYWVLRLRALRARKPLRVWDEEELESWEQSERPYQLDEDNKDSIDTVYFYGGEADSTKPTLIVRLARRPGRTAELWFMLRLPDGTILEHPLLPDTHVSDTSATSWSAGGFSISCSEPMQRWQLRYHGLMKRGIAMQLKQQVSHSCDDYVRVNLRATFRASVNPFDSKTDLSPKLVASFIAKEPWSSAFFEKLKRNEDQVHIEQWGTITGDLSVDDCSYSLDMIAYRDHSYGLRDWRQFYRYAAHFGFLEDGTCFSFGSVSIPQTTSHVKYGYLYQPSGKKCPVEAHDFNLWQHGELAAPPKRYRVQLIADGRDFAFDVSAGPDIPLFVQNAACLIYERFTEFRVNGLRGWGITEFCYWNHRPQDSPPQKSLPLPPTPAPTLESDTAQFLSLRDAACRRESLAGGKAARLAQLAAVFDQDEEEEEEEEGREASSESAPAAKVPAGLAVTTRCFAEFRRRQPQIDAAVRALRRSLIEGEGDAAVTAACNRVAAAFAEAELDPEIVAELQRRVSDVIGEGEYQLLAVRSSACGEDSAGASCAGQMESFLAVTRSQLPRRVIDCWASLFAERAVRYRHSAGAGVDASMSVLVQAMAPAAAAGVAFSVDPATADSSVVRIDANFGLGESVVSGQVTPDSFSVRRFPDGHVQLGDCSLGEKSLVMQVDPEAVDGGVVTKDASPESAGRASISEATVLQVAALAVQLERRYGQPVDLEFAVDTEGSLYLLQARPITTLHAETNEELLHEMDSAYPLKENWYTTCNIGEMCPGAVTPLTNSLFGRAIDWSMMKFKAAQIGILNEVPRPNSGLVSCGNHLVINLMQIGLVSEISSLTGRFDMACVALLGRTLHEPTIADLRRYAGSTAGFLVRLRRSILDAFLVLRSTSATAAWERKLLDGWHVQPQYTAKEQFRRISSRLPDYGQCWYDTIVNTSRSAIDSMVLLSQLMQQFGENEAFSKLASCLANCDNVYSADVPNAMRAVADAVAEAGAEQRERFLQLPAEEAAQWLLSHESGAAGESFRAFIDKHGFRCIREAELRETSWRRSPEKVVRVLQAIMAAGQTQQQEQEQQQQQQQQQQSVPELAASLGLRGFGKTRLAQLLIPRARRGVALREWGKAISIRMADTFKEAYIHLGELLVREELLPDSDLTYFLTHRELGLVAERRDPAAALAAVQRAQRRRALLPEQQQLQLPELFKGNPRHVLKQQQQQQVVSDPEASASGMPVSRGVAIGPARVVTSLSEAASIQSGDILLVPYTDVGWSPYFPLIAGLATEKGGLLSHGAVVAREFGIPCVVGVRDATKLIANGQTVRLDGDRGLVQRIADQQQQ